MKLHLIISIAAILMVACGSKPKVITSEASSGDPGYNTAPVHDADMNNANDIHKVVCLDFLQAEKYTYLQVEEHGEQFWIAVPKRDVEKGKTYYYTGGLKKNNFRSSEFNRVFETLYLVSGVTESEPYAGSSALDEAYAEHSGQNPAEAPVNVAPREGDVKISELFENRTKYDGMVVSVTGKCVKINRMIMGRNWVHIEDGSMKGDLTITTTDDVPVGTVATLSGTIGLNKDFGAGYRYEVIMENAHVVK